MIIELIDFDTALAQVNEDLRVVNSSHIHQKIFEASSVVMKYLKLTEVPESWSDDPDASPIVYTVPFDIQCATALIFGTLWQYREGSNPSSFREMDPLSPAVISLLTGYRDPTMA